ncbi:glycosyltransferase family 4 protein [Empedobacter brevis]|uniref:glycosyltransferase family 4 protein n=1 Tax=Empedobacter brevis TaxID=247 RepID=UPI00333EA85D
MKNRLLVICPISGPPNGVKVISEFLLDELSESFDIDLIDTAQAKEFNDFGKFSFKKIFDVLFIAIKLLFLKEAKKVYINLSVKGFSLYRDIFFISILLLRKSNITSHIHANGLEKISNNFVRKIINKTKLIVINEKQQEELKNYKKIFLVYNSLPDYYKGKLIKNRNNKLRILYFSNISKEKGSLRLKEFCNQAKELEHKIEIIICGGILDEFSQNIIEELRLFNFVKILDPIFETSKKMDLFRKSDLFIFLSNENYEVFPLVYLEAMMNGLPILTTKQIVSHKVIQNNNGKEYKQETNMMYVKTLLEANELKLQQDNARIHYENFANFNNFCNQVIKIINVNR